MESRKLCGPDFRKGKTKTVGFYPLKFCSAEQSYLLQTPAVIELAELCRDGCQAFETIGNVSMLKQIPAKYLASLLSCECTMAHSPGISD